MLFCQLGGCHSIRDISNVLRSITGNINHLGVSTAPSKSTIAYQNTHRSWKVFRDYYYVLRQRLGQQRGNWHGLANIGAKIKLLDSSTITMSLSAFPWAHYTHEKGAVKLHTLLDLDMQVPDFIHITDGKHTDAKSAFEIPISKGEVIVADRGYQDFELLRFWDSKKAFFVVRHRLDLQFDSRSEIELPDVGEEHILKDEIIFLKNKPTLEKYPKELRRVVVFVEGKEHAIELLTNNFTWDSSVVAALYKDRWYIESFFKSVKQLLHI
ncbi:MAG: IS4 family transposase, partial [Akkermansia sp.]